jgi:Protein of unknown function (DUF1524)/Excalibur calcium-binding domain
VSGRTTVFNPPPGWPPAPSGWAPEPGWQPDPSWPPAPVGWEWWTPPHRRSWARRHVGLTIASAVVGALVVVSSAIALTTPSTTDPVVADTRPVAGSPSPTPPPTTLSANPSPTASPSVTAEASKDPDAVIAAARPRTALAFLGGLAVKGRAPKTGYDREAFGPAWTDTNRNGCDTRNDILRRDLDDNVYKPGTRGCAVLSGWLAPDPYTGQDIAFVRGGASEVDIDHVVALSDAWQKGAGKWVPGKRLAFANDPLNLLAVDASANRQKGDGDAATWLPRNKAFRCTYVARQVAVKAKYELWVTSAERAAVAGVLARCPDTKAPSGSAPTIAPVRASIRSRAPKTQAPAPDGKLDQRFPFCKDLPAGYGPYYRGSDPEYAWYRDSDGDGVVCE